MFLFLGGICFFVSSSSLAQRKAQVLHTDTDVYKDADFDSEVIGSVDPDVHFQISKKNYSGFFKVKFPDGSLGYIPDTELNIEGVGAFQAKPYVGDEEEKIRKQKPKSKNSDDEDEDTDEQKLVYHGLTVQLINYHENTLGGTQTGDLTAIGYKYMPMAGNYDTSTGYEFFVAPKAPDYYAEKTGGSASGAIFWGAADISNIAALSPKTSLHYGAGPFAKYSYFTVQNAVNNPQKKYNLQDLTVGLDLQAGILLHSRYMTIDLGLRYFWDKVSYGGLGVAFLF